MLATLTLRYRCHVDEILCAELRPDGTLRVRFVTLKTRDFPVDDLTPEARLWLVPTMAPREIPDGEPELEYTPDDTPPDEEPPAGATEASESHEDGQQGS